VTCALFHRHFRAPYELPQDAQLNTCRAVCNWTTTTHLYIPNSRVFLMRRERCSNPQPSAGETLTARKRPLSGEQCYGGLTDLIRADPAIRDVNTRASLSHHFCP
jgi:hypothetical protein